VGQHAVPTVAGLISFARVFERAVDDNVAPAAFAAGAPPPGGDSQSKPASGPARVPPASSSLHCSSTQENP